MINERYILAIESSCDDTSAAIFKEDKILANVTANQTIHEKFGGVVPELAARAHMQHIWPLVYNTLDEANIAAKDISVIAFTRGPGLVGSLIVGVNFAKALAVGLDVPVIEVNHMQAHVAAHYINKDEFPFPFLCLTVSGGHTQLVVVKDYLEMEVIGDTRDDAAGEAFDKAAKMLGLPYPGGPAIDKHAQNGNPLAYSFNKPKVEGCNFSFSGFKTAILYFLQKQEDGFIENNLADLCASIQHTIVEILLEKVRLAVKQTGIKHVGIGGGVAANSLLRTAFEKLGEENGWQTSIPSFEYCTDNAGMIGMVAYHKLLAEDFAALTAEPTPRYAL